MQLNNVSMVRIKRPGVDTLSMVMLQWLMTPDAEHVTCEGSVLPQAESFHKKGRGRRLIHDNGEETSPLLLMLRPGLTMGELNKLTGIPKPTLSRMLNKQRRLQICQAKRIAQALNLPLETVIDTLS